jgi:hypothetical protein
MQKFMMKVKKMKTMKSKKSQSQKANEELDFTLSNMRMTICELG